MTPTTSRIREGRWIPAPQPDRASRVDDPRLRPRGRRGHPGLHSSTSETFIGTSELTNGLAPGAGCAINLTVAEYIISRNAAQHRHATSLIGA
jgi:hypothetical protein